MRSLVTTSALAGSSLLVFLFLAPAQAAEIEAHSAIDAVTVFPDAAVVTRIAQVDLPEGDSVLAFKDLPLTLDPASLRVAGAGDAKIAIGAVDSDVEPAAAKPPDSALEAKLASLKAEREALRSKIDTLQAKRAMILNYAKASPEKLTLDSKPLDVSQWGAAWDAVANGLFKLGDDLRPAEAQAHALDEEIKALEAQRQRPSPATAPRRAANVALNAASQTHATITLSYRIAGANWVPAYDAALDTSAKSVALARRALLSQRTGEDWSNVALTLSTARVARSADAPDVRPIKIDFWQPPVYTPLESQRTLSAAPQSAQAPAPMAKKDMAPAKPSIPAEETASEGESGAYSAEFKVPGRVSLAADGAQKSFLLARVSAPAAIVAKTAPGLDQTAYLEAHLTAAGDAPLLPGEVALHRDDTFVGRERIGFVAPGDGFDLGFGADDKIKVARAPLNRKENEPTWYNQTKIETRQFKTTVKNLHDFPVKIQVIDRLPYSENVAITAELLPATTPPTEKQVGDKRGVMSWTLDLQPGESKDVILAYRLKWPADRDIVIGAATPVPAAR
ncbi:MAG TPA: mucoidy inhibitor MuiA family protein [Roseiarcus sp.]|nr:mucoidy inhibitor MuiA family protein [Roseiarcus sp.]